MKTLILLTLLAATAAAEPTGSCGTNLLPYMNARTAGLGGRYTPKKDCRYPLQATAAFQKIKGGYLIVPAPHLHWRDPMASILLTKGEYEQDQELTGQAYYVGETQYTSITGFTVTAHTYQEATGPAASGRIPNIHDQVLDIEKLTTPKRSPTLEETKQALQLDWEKHNRE